MYGNHGMGIFGSHLPGTERAHGRHARAQATQVDYRTSGVFGYDAPPGYALVPLGQIEQAELATRRKQIWTGIIVALVAGAIIYLLVKSTQPTPQQVVGKMSTARIAKNLYKRLEANGRGSESVRRSLAQMSKED